MFAAMLQPGDVFQHRMAGGGGWGDARKRAPESLAQGVLNEKVSA
jgi:N-methylhydantoinase B/oxoprolinase/acetone carboxylase alpha subunit